MDISGNSASRKRNDVYWATLPPDECAQRIFDIRDAFRKAVKASSLYPRWVRAFRSFHGLPDSVSGDASVLSRRGSKGHRASLRTSRAAVDARHQIGLVAPAIPALDAIPVNTAYKTLSQIREGKRFFDYYVERRGLGQKLYQTAQNCQKFGVAWLLTDWDHFAGQPLQPPDPADPSRTTTGDVVFRALTPLDSVIDVNQDGEHDWFIGSDKINRWEALRRYGQDPTEEGADPNAPPPEPTFTNELATAILNAPSVYDDDKWTNKDFALENLQTSMDTDLIRVLTLYHRKTRALPAGRMLRVISADAWLFDGPLPYEDIPIAEMNAGKIWNTPFGDSTYHHALGAEQARDRALSAIVTNVLATGHQLVSIQDENFDLQELSDGVSAIVNKPGPGGGPPTGISLTASNSEGRELVMYLDKAIDAAMAVNSVIRGEPEANIKSGAYGGLLVQQATQYNSDMQYAFQRCVETTGNHLLTCLKRYADRPQLAEISGPNGQWRLQEFTKEDYSSIHRLVAKPGNPAEQTAVFRKQKADTLMEAGLITSAQQYEAMINTQDADLATEDGEAEELNIIRENEVMLKLADGVQDEDTDGVVPAPGEMQAPPQPGMPPPAPILVPPVLMTDNDALHVRKHAAQLNSPQARGNPQLVQIIGAHNAWHMQNSMTKPPLLALMLGQPTPQMAMPPELGGPDGKGPPQEKGPNGVQKPKPVTPPPEGRPSPGAGP